ncbi:DUF3261 domain-containing protein [Pseudoalteromonas pernae]|uniref:DUF3261 domain-containing protein n=1 Tax=Pseudoalteromonas pernae TaxID=3118054 RepID=UPI0032429773
MRAILLLVILFISGCAAIEHKQTGETVYFQPATSLTLSAPSAELLGNQWQKRMYVTRGGSSKTLLSQLAIDDNGKVNLAVMTAVGIPVLTLTFDQVNGIQAKEFVDLAGLNPQYILADIQLVHWSATQLQAHLQGAKINEYLSPRGQVREVLDEERVIMTITYEQNAVVLKNELRDYEIRFEEVIP